MSYYAWAWLYAFECYRVGMPNYANVHTRPPKRGSAKAADNLYGEVQLHWQEGGRHHIEHWHIQKGVHSRLWLLWKGSEGLQSLAIGNAITSDKTPSWFIRYVLFVLTQDNFQIHLYNLRLLIVHDEVVPANESLGSKERRLRNLTRCQNLYDSHKARWVNSLKEQISKENAAMDLSPPNSPANLAKMHQIQKYITRLQCKYSIL